MYTAVLDNAVVVDIGVDRYSRSKARRSGTEARNAREGRRGKVKARANVDGSPGEVARYEQAFFMHSKSPEQGSSVRALPRHQTNWLVHLDIVAY